MKAKRYLVLSDLHIPDHDKRTLNLVYRFISDYKPDFIDLLGDQVNFTRISKYEQDPHYHVDLADEIKEAKAFLVELLKIAKKANRNVEVTWFDGHHEDRRIHYLARNAAALAELDMGEELLISIPHLLELKRLGVKYVPYKSVEIRHGVAFMHGTVVRAKSGYTGHAYIEKYGLSGFSGHTHRRSDVSKNQMGIERWWIELGCLCNLNPTPNYVTNPDWVQGFAVAEYDPDTDKMYPTLIRVLDHSFNFGGKTYKEDK